MLAGGENAIESTTYDSEGAVQQKIFLEYTFDAEGNMTVTTHFSDSDAIIWFIMNSEDITLESGYQSSSGDDVDFVSLEEYDKKGNVCRITDYFKNFVVINYTTYEYEYGTVLVGD